MINKKKNLLKIKLKKLNNFFYHQFLYFSLLLLEHPKQENKPQLFFLGLFYY